MDKEDAFTCVSVLANDGNLGTISHLTTLHRTDEFARELRQLYGGRSGVPICLSGGEDSKESIKLILGLYKHLKEQGFLVSLLPEHSELMGKYRRQAILFPGKVMVRRASYANPKLTETKELMFPREEVVLHQSA